MPYDGNWVARQLVSVGITTKHNLTLTIGATVKGAGEQQPPSGIGKNHILWVKFLKMVKMAILENHEATVKLSGK